MHTHTCVRAQEGRSRGGRSDGGAQLVPRESELRWGGGDKVWGKGCGRPGAVTETTVPMHGGPQPEKNKLLQATEGKNSPPDLQSSP